LPVVGAGRLVAQPAAVAAVGQCSDLVAGESDQVALADEPFVAEPGQRFGLGALRPLRDQPARRARSGRRVLDGDDARKTGSLTARP
jgi:hypothetical protein